MDSLREKLIELIKVLPEDRLQIVLDFVNHINQNSFVGEDFDELQMDTEIGDITSPALMNKNGSREPSPCDPRDPFSND